MATATPTAPFVILCRQQRRGGDHLIVHARYESQMQCNLDLADLQAKNPFPQDEGGKPKKYANVWDRPTVRTFELATEETLKAATDYEVGSSMPKEAAKKSGRKKA